jgi:uncharacterized protein
MQQQQSCTAFRGMVRIASGSLKEVALKAKAVIDADENARVLIFDDSSAHPVEMDFRGTPADVLGRLEKGVAAETEVSRPYRGPGRPKLGVVAREVTLLPRHWDWLNKQPGGASVTLRKLVEEARRGSSAKELVRRSQETAYRFMVALAGNEEGFEEAACALFVGNKERFNQQIQTWPADVRDHARGLAAPAFEGHTKI